MSYLAEIMLNFTIRFEKFDSFFFAIVTLSFQSKASAKCDFYGETGKTVSLTLQTSEKLTRFQWSRGTNIIFRKRGDQILQGKAGDIDDKGSLILTALKKENEGSYEYEISKEDGRSAQSKEIYLCVLGK